MKGVILAGGSGSRMAPLNLITNKHLIPVGRLHMISYPYAHLLDMGIKAEDICVVTGGEHHQAILSFYENVLPNDNPTPPIFVQKRAGGIAQALGCAESFLRDEKMAVILGDNIFELRTPIFKSSKEYFENQVDRGAMLFYKEVKDPERFGVLVYDGEKNLRKIVEKPKRPSSPFAVTGLYFYDSSVFERINTLKPSKRGELEVTDLNNSYLGEEIVNLNEVQTFWSDAGTHQSNAHCAGYVRTEIPYPSLDSPPQSLESYVAGRLGIEFGS